MSKGPNAAHPGPREVTEPAAPKTTAASLPWKISRQGYIPILLLVLLGLAATLALVQEVTRLERERVITAFSAAARDRVLVVQRGLQSSLNVVQDVGSFFDANPRIRRSQFREFVQPVLKRDPGVQSLEWVPRVDATKRGAFITAARTSFPRFTITDRSGKPLVGDAQSEHFPLLFAHPYTRGLTPLGLDLSRVPEELAMLERARASHSIQVDQGVGNLPQSSGQVEFTVYLPVFELPLDESTSLDELEDSSDQTPGPLRGFAIGRFLLGEIVDRALSNLSPSGIDIEFRTTPENGVAQTLFVHHSRTRDQNAPAAPANDVREMAFDIEIAGNRWTAICTSVPGRFEFGHWSPGLVLGGGVAFTLLLAAYLFTLIGRTEKVERLVSQRTLELEYSNRALNRQMNERLKAEHALQALNTTLEQRIAARTGEAERKAAELEQFAYVTSHDLKAPLRAISNLATWLAEDLDRKLTPETRDQLNLMRDRVGRMHELVEGLLSYSRIGRAESQPEQVDTNELLAELIDSIAPPPGFHIEVAAEMPVLFTDRLQLGQVFANLIGNSIKHHHRQSGRVIVSGSDRGSYYEFSVRDDGPGIPAEYHQKVFKMFQTLNVKDFGGDTGIGLALVKKIVEEHGGLVTLASEEGKGTELSFTWARESPQEENLSPQDNRVRQG